MSYRIKGVQVLQEMTYHFILLESLALLLPSKSKKSKPFSNDISRNTGEILESLDGHETVQVDTRKVRKEQTLIVSNDEYLPFDDDPEFEDIPFNFFSAGKWIIF